MRKITLNADGTPRKKYTTKKMIMAKNRKNGQKKAWDTRRALYPETNGFKPKMVEDTSKVQPKNEKPIPKEEGRVGFVRYDLELLSKLDDFLNSIPGVKFDRDKFISEVLTNSVETVLRGVTVVCHGQEELTKKLKNMMEFVKEK
jgi:hypothetical protein